VYLVTYLPYSGLHARDARGGPSFGDIQHSEIAPAFGDSIALAVG
jgi:hypothetical protein